MDGASETTLRTAEPTREEPPRETAPDPHQAAAPAPYVILPRAAGGGAGAVAAPVAITQAPGPAPVVSSHSPAIPWRPQVSAADTPPVEATGEQPGAPPPAAWGAEAPRVATVSIVREPLPTTARFEAAPVALATPAVLEPAATTLAAPAPAAAWSDAAASPDLSPPPSLPSAATAVSARRYLRLAFRFAAALLLGLAGLVLALVVLYRWVDPPLSTLMLGQRLAGTPIRQIRVPLERMSPSLPLAVVMSEDARFCRHSGVDWGELKDAIEQAMDGNVRGGSTITMQVVKNLFLWPSKSYLRKALEIPLAYLIEVAWPKRRILEIYLNIAEWGPGIFGAEAAARYHFRKPALLLGPREAALLAVSLPNPFEREAGSPGPGTLRLADNLLVRMRAAQGSAGCVRVKAAQSGPTEGRRIVSGQGRRQPL